MYEDWYYNELMIEYIGELVAYDDLVIFTYDHNSYYSSGDYEFDVL